MISECYDKLFSLLCEKKAFEKARAAFAEGRLHKTTRDSRGHLTELSWKYCKDQLTCM